MQEKYSHEGLIKLAEQVALRYSIGDARMTKLGNLMLFLKFSVNWRACLYSERALQNLWDKLVIEVGDPELIISMTSEFVYRAGLNEREDGLGSPNAANVALATSLSWVGKSKAMSEELTSLSATTSDVYLTLFKANPWASFVYLLSMSDALEKAAANSASFLKALNTRNG